MDEFTLNYQSGYLRRTGNKVVVLMDASMRLDFPQDATGAHLEVAVEPGKPVIWTVKNKMGALTHFATRVITETFPSNPTTIMFERINHFYPRHLTHLLDLLRIEKQFRVV